MAGETRLAAPVPEDEPKESPVVACRKPVIAQAMGVQSINSRSRSKMVSSSKSKPAMKPPQYPQPASSDPENLTEAVAALRVVSGLVAIRYNPCAVP